MKLKFLAIVLSLCSFNSICFADSTAISLADRIALKLDGTRTECPEKLKVYESECIEMGVSPSLVRTGVGLNIKQTTPWKLDGKILTATTKEDNRDFYITIIPYEDYKSVIVISPKSAVLKAPRQTVTQQTNLTNLKGIESVNVDDISPMVKLDSSFIVTRLGKKALALPKNGKVYIPLFQLEILGCNIEKNGVIAKVSCDYPNSGTITKEALIIRL